MLFGKTRPIKLNINFSIIYLFYFFDSINISTEVMPGVTGGRKRSRSKSKKRSKSKRK